MNTLRQFVPALMLGLTIAIAGVAFAQSANQAGDDKKASCCCMSGGCCADHMQKGEMKRHARSSDKNGCCGCCGESCSMMKKDTMTGQSSSKDACCGCCGYSCQKKDTVKNHVTAFDKRACCCCGDSCEMKDGTRANATAVKGGSSAGHKCCGDSCKMKNLKEKP